MGDTILFVEDSPDDQFLFEHTIRKLPFEIHVQFANDGDAALDYLKGEAQFSDRLGFPLPTVIFLDIKMPGRGGFEVLEWLKKESPPHLRRIPVVMFSSSGAQEDIDRAYDLGASAYLVKPSGFDKLHGLFKATGEFFIEHAERPTVVPR